MKFVLLFPVNIASEIIIIIIVAKFLLELLGLYK